MVPVGFSAEDNKYDEYIVINGDLEKVGSWEVDLNGYATTDYVNQELEKKVDYVEGSRLITAEESAKLEALQLNGEDLQKSGNINTSQIIDLKQWLGLNAQSTPGLSENNYTTEDKQKLQDLLYIKSVDETQLHVSNAGTLSILSVDVNKITGLDDILNTKATKASVSNLTTQLNAYTEEVNDRLDGIENRLKWHPLTDE